MVAISHRILRAGTLNLPGAVYPAKKVAEDVLLKDAQQFHCFFRQAGLHNHLSHHILAAYDLGASGFLLQKIYEREALIQRPIYLDEKDKDIEVTENNWNQHLGNQNAYGSYFKFFLSRIQAAGVPSTLNTYVFDPTSNVKGTSMLARLVAGAVHPFIQVGYGLEFEIDTLVASGLAQAAVHNPRGVELYNPPPATGTSSSVFDILKEVYDSAILKPVMPYDPNALISKRSTDALKDGRLEEMRRIVATLPSPMDVEKTVEEAVWAAVLLLFSTGKPGREPRLDFFLMHIVTSSVFLRTYLQVVQDKKYQEDLVRAWLLTGLLVVESRGRPVIKPELAMGYTMVPRPPTGSDGLGVDKGSIGDPRNDKDYNPWPTIISSVLNAPDCHVPKTLRTLIMGARDYGNRAPGELGNALPGLEKVDGTLFVRAAGMLMDYMGWVGHGQKAREDWDRSALGWDKAWE